MVSMNKRDRDNTFDKIESLKDQDDNTANNDSGYFKNIKNNYEGI